MPNNFFKFKEFTVYQEKCAMKVGTDAVLLGAWVNLDGCRKVLDIGTGTGILSLMAAQRSGCIIDALEVDADACLQAKSNICQSSWSDRIKIYNVSLQRYIYQYQTLYDLIICNPPFFISNLKSQDEKRNLARNAENLTFNELIRNASVLLNKNGRLAVIIPFELRNKFASIINAKNLKICRQTVVRHSSSHNPVRILIEVSNNLNAETETGELNIYDINGEKYSDEYIHLTQPYYLYF